MLDHDLQSIGYSTKQPAPASKRLVAIVFTVLALLFVAMLFVPSRREVLGQAQSDSSAASLWPISIDYPENESIFPPGITPPTFLWRDGMASTWHIDFAFAGGAPALHFESKGERMHLAPIDPDCVSATNELPKLTPQQAASWAWTPDAATWQNIQSNSTKAPATLTVTGYDGSGKPVSVAHIAFSTSVDPVGAPIFYRDVPLMPSAGANGTVQPLSPDLIHLIRWRLKDIRSPESRTVLTNMPTCANCHSFSTDGKTMGIDVDGPANDKGLYAIVPIQKEISIQNKDIVEWNTDGQAGKARVGFMSRVSPDGRYVVSTFAGTSTEDISNTYYVTNFKDYRFLQVFYPTRGILEVYNRSTKKREPLPGADDPEFVQTDGVWSPDQKYIVFARAKAEDPYPPGQKKALFANDPNETQIQYDLYKVPFNDGRGGTPEPILGASNNGMSNNFPKVSPDGRWIVFVECRNGQLMRPDSQLYIVPFEGGQARRLRANTSLMNSWHSWSPNGRWLVFSSKARSPYTQMYLTHIDENGNSSPAILVDNTTASNRAVNLPEFVNIPPDGLEAIKVPAVEQYRIMDQAMKMEENGQNDQAVTLWRNAVAMDPDNAKAQNGLGISLYIAKNIPEALEHLHRAIQINPLSVDSHYVLGKLLLEQGHPDDAISEFETAVTIRHHFASAEEGLASAYQAEGKQEEALAHWRDALSMDPNGVSAMLGAAWLLATSSEASLRNGAEAISLAENANRLEPSEDPEVLDTLAAAYAENGQFDLAVATATRASELAEQKGNRKMANAIKARVQQYRARRPFHTAQPVDVSDRTVASATGLGGTR
jgi:tetratricopeptide (TPR) repeat protein